MTNGIRHVAVVGLMGAGKSTVGVALAAELGWAFRDSDLDIERVTGHTVKELGEEAGVPAMHELEARQLLAALDDPAPSVVSAAASTIDVEACRARLRDPDVAAVWLRARPATLAERFGSSPHRPWYGSDPATFLAEQAAQRYPLFESIHPSVVDVDGLAPEDVVTAALGALRAAGLAVAGGDPVRVSGAPAPPGHDGGPGTVSHGPSPPGRMDLQGGRGDV